MTYYFWLYSHHKHTERRRTRRRFFNVQQALAWANKRRKYIASATLIIVRNGLCYLQGIQIGGLYTSTYSNYRK